MISPNRLLDYRRGADRERSLEGGNSARQSIPITRDGPDHRQVLSRYGPGGPIFIGLRVLPCCRSPVVDSSPEEPCPVSDENGHIHDLLRKLNTEFDSTASRVGIVLAAGHGKRIRSETSKMLHPIWGRPSALRVAEAVYSGLESPNQVVVVGMKGADVIRSTGSKPGRVFAYRRTQPLGFPRVLATLPESRSRHSRTQATTETSISFPVIWACSQLTSSRDSGASSSLRRQI